MMRMQIERTWQRWKEAVKFIAWGVTMALVCFLLYRVIVNSNTTRQPVPLSAERRDSLMTVAFPADRADTLLHYDAFQVHFNSGRGIADYAAYELTAGELHGDARRQDEFARDEGVNGCPAPTDYAGSGMDRGHLIPARDLKWSENAMCQSFLMTNICPMAKTLNEGGWAKLEEKVREWTVRDSALLVYAGPVVCAGDTTLANGRVTVPSAFFKVILAPCVSPMRAIAFIYPNGHSGGRLSQYAVSIDEVERRTGLDFFPTLPAREQQRLESGVLLDAWTN